MLTGSAITRAFTIVVMAAALAGLWQYFIGGAVPARRPAEIAATASPAVARPAPPPAAQPEPVRTASAEPVVATPEPFRLAPAPPPAIAAPAEPPAATPPPVFAAPAALAFAEDPPAAPPPEPESPPAAGPTEGIDLNTASLADLNALRGGGHIGKAIVAGRPYTSPQDLLSRRILSRSVFLRIKDQVTVR
ncbi:ComEA family DNA-binding protein [Methylobacterium sp. JK268]